MKLVTLWVCLHVAASYKITYSDWYKNIWMNFRSGAAKQKFKCDKVQSFGTHGTIVSPNSPSHYPNNADCTWVIETPTEYTELEIEFVRFNVENLKWTRLCLKDFLEIYQYPNGKKEKKGKFCGKKSGHHLTLYGNKFEFRFKSNRFRTKKGFVLKWRAVKGCGGIVNGNHGNLNLPFSNSTEKHFYCEWKITNSRDKHQVRLNIEKLNIQHNDGLCRRSYLQVINGDGQIVAQYCESISTPQSIRISGQHMVVRIKLTKKTKFSSLEASWKTIQEKTIGSCGVPSVQSNTNNNLHHHRIKRLVGGRRARQGELPWLSQVRVTVITKYYRTRIITCGGVVISPSYILTAAHCVKRKNDVTSYEILIGTVSEDFTERSNRIVVKGKHIFPHPQYKIERSTGKPQNDIALIKLSRKLDFDYNIQPICLPGKEQIDLHEENCEFAGWGKTHENRLHSKHLNSIGARLEGHCDNTNTIICATYRGRDKVGACKGDSGSPLTCTKKDGRKYLVGLLSYGGRRCPSPVDGHVNVAYYMEWIENVMENNVNSENE